MLHIVKNRPQNIEIYSWSTVGILVTDKLETQFLLVLHGPRATRQLGLFSLNKNLLLPFRPSPPPSPAGLADRPVSGFIVSYQVDWSPAVLLAGSIDKGFLLASLFSIWLYPLDLVQCTVVGYDSRDSGQIPSNQSTHTNYSVYQFCYSVHTVVGYDLRDSGHIPSNQSTSPLFYPLDL